MIVHELKTVYIHIPKTAGVSIAHALMSNVLNKETAGAIKELPENLKIRFGLRGEQKHKFATGYVPKIISLKKWNEYYKFAFVRNPWDKVISEYHWRLSLAPKDHKFKGFNQFLDHCERRVSGTEKGIYWTHAQPQLKYVSDGTRIIVDEIFKFEEIPAAIHAMEQRLNISIKLKRHNTSKHKHYREYYNDATRQRVFDLYRDDIEAFDYEF